MLKPLGVNNHRVHLKKTSKIICKCLQCSLQLSSEGSSVDTSVRKNISAREKDWADALGILNQGSWGSGDDLAQSLRTQYSNSRSTRWSDAQRSDFSVNKDFTIGPRDGSENFSSKTNLRSFGLYRDCSKSLCQN